MDALSALLNNAEKFILDHKANGDYHVDNPSYTGGESENFADKWNEHPERAEAFIRWIRKAKTDLIGTKLYSLNRVHMAENIKISLGTTTGIRVFNEMAEEEKRAIAAQEAKIATVTGTISASGTIPIPPNHHHGS